MTERVEVERITLRPEEAAQALGVCRRTIYNLMDSGELPSIKIRGARRIRVSDLKALAGEK